MHFRGYARPDGRVGTRNYVGVLSTVVCANEVVERIGRSRLAGRVYFIGFKSLIIVILTGVRVLRGASLELVDTMPDAEMVGFFEARPERAGAPEPKVAPGGALEGPTHDPCR